MINISYRNPLRIRCQHTCTKSHCTRDQCQCQSELYTLRPGTRIVPRKRKALSCCSRGVVFLLDVFERSVGLPGNIMVVSLVEDLILRNMFYIMWIAYGLVEDQLLVTKYDLTTLYKDLLYVLTFECIYYVLYILQYLNDINMSWRINLKTVFNPIQ